MKRVTIIIFILILPILLPAQELRKVRVTPQWMPQSQFAGIYIAYHNGYYKEAGLDVEIIHPAAAISSMQMLSSGSTDIITSQLVEAMIYYDGGLDLVNILQTSAHNSLMIVSREPLKEVGDLSGKKIGRWKAGFSELAMAFAIEKGLEVEWIPFTTNIALYISGAIDATLCMEYNEYYQLVMSGTEIAPSQVLKFRDIGYDIPEDGMYVMREYYNTHQEVVDKFVEATKKGWEWARNPENHEAALDCIMKWVKEYHTPTNKVNQHYMLESILAAQEDDSVAKYELTRERFDFTLNLLLNNNFVISDINYEDFVTKH